MSKYEDMAKLFYAGHKLLKKATDSGKLIDKRLESEYGVYHSNIHFDMSNYLKYFDYEALSKLPNFDQNILLYYSK